VLIVAFYEVHNIADEIQTSSNSVCRLH